MYTYKDEMALIDDRDWLISHIRHCFVTSDESGFCEHVLGKDEEWKRIIEDDKEEGIGRRGDQLPVYARSNDEGAEGRFGKESICYCVVI